MLIFADYGRGRRSDAMLKNADNLISGFLGKNESGATINTDMLKGAKSLSNGLCIMCLLH